MGVAGEGLFGTSEVCEFWGVYARQTDVDLRRMCEMG